MVVLMLFYINKKADTNCISLILLIYLSFCRGSGIRTHDPLLPKQNDKESYLVAYQLIAMMQANHFKDSSKNAILRALF